MRKIGIIDLQEALNKAEEILGDNYDFFKRLITSFSITPAKPTWDIAIFLTSLKIAKGSTKFEKWLEFWNNYSSVRKYKNFRYHPSMSFSPFFSEEEAEQKFSKMLKYLYTSEKDLTESQYWGLFFSLFYKLRSIIRPRFSKVEFKVFLTILDEQSTSLSVINKNLKMAKSNLSNYLKRIREKRLIFEGFLLNLSKFNLSMFFSRIKYPLACKKTIRKIIPEGKFLRRIYEGHIGCNYTMLNYLAPNLEKTNSLILKDKKIIIDSIPDAEIDSFKSDRNSRLYSFNYIYYDFKKGKWKFDIDDINYNLYLLKSTTKSNTSVKIIENFQKDSNSKLKFDKETLDILRFFYLNPQKSISQIIQELDIRESKIRKAITSFEKNSILKTRVNPGPVFGLSSIIFFLDEKKEKTRKIHTEMSFFPEVYTEPLMNIETKKEELIVVVRIPEMIAIPTLEVLYNKYKRKIVDLFIIDQMYSTRQDLPLENFDTLFKKWKI